MKTVGIIGGIGPESTVDYYRSILAAYSEARPDGSSPSMIINSIDLQRLRQMFECSQHDQAVAYLSSELRRLAAAGADFAVLSANTPHLVFDELRPQSPMPLISIVEATRDAAKAMGVAKLGLLGTRFTMQGRFYPDVFAREDMQIVSPPGNDQAWIHEKYFDELVKGVFLPQTRQEFLAVINRMKEETTLAGCSSPEPNCRCCCAAQAARAFPSSIPRKSMSRPSYESCWLRTCHRPTRIETSRSTEPNYPIALTERSGQR